jgi:hypothetical protein
LLVVLLLLVYIYLNPKKEGFHQVLPNNVIEQTELVDPNACYPGTYWRHNTYQKTCQSTNSSKPLKVTTDGNIGVRTPDSRYKLFCTVDSHLNRDCKLIKVSQNHFY